MRKLFFILSFFALLSFNQTLFAQITVDVFNDELDEAAFECSELTVGTLSPNDTSLREAICAANNTAGEDTIILPPGTYDLTLLPIGQDSNLGGDLDISDSLIIEAVNFETGGRATIRNGIGNQNVKGDGDRVLHVLDRPASLTLNGIIIKDGDLGCGSGVSANHQFAPGDDEFLCDLGASGIEMQGTGDLTLNYSEVIENQMSCNGNCCGAQNRDASVDGVFYPAVTEGPNVAGIRILGDGKLNIFNSKINDNTSMCMVVDDPLCFPGEQPLNVNTHVENNNIVSLSISNCSAGAAAIFISEGSEFNMEDSEIDGNSASCQGMQCRSGEIVSLNDSQLSTQELPVTIKRSSITNNISTCTGDLCQSDELYEADADGDTLYEEFILENNEVSCFGFDCDSDEILSSECGTSGQKNEVKKSSISHNIAQCEGTECDSDEIAEYNNCNDNLFEDTKIDHNTVFCKGLGCDSDEIFPPDSSDNITINNVSVSYNRLICEETNCDTDEVFEGSASTGMVINKMDIIGNYQRCTGFYCDGDEFIDQGSDNVTVNDLTFSKNISECFGQYCELNEIFSITGGDWTFNNLVVSDNITRCTSQDCTSGIPGFSYRGGDTVTINKAIISNNTSIYDDTSATRDGLGSGLNNLRNGTININNSSIFGNSTYGSGAGIFNGAALDTVGGPANADVFTQENFDNEVMIDDLDVFPGGGTININNTAIYDNIADANNNGIGLGGGIFNVTESENGSPAVINITNSTISGNNADEGGGIYQGTNETFDFDLTTLDPDFVDIDSISDDYDGINEEENSDTNITNTTISNNRAASSAPGIGVSDETINIRNSIVAFQSGGGPNCLTMDTGSINPDGNNIDDLNNCGFDIPNTDPMIRDLQFNGGCNKTHALKLGSPAIDAIADGDCMDFDSNTIDMDQREFPRPVDGDEMGDALCDIGSYEFQSFISVSKTTDPQGLTGFEFTGAGFPGPCDDLNGDFTLDDQQTKSCLFTGDPSGTYTITEEIPEGFDLTTKCDQVNNSGNVSILNTDNGVEITLGGPLDSASCEFTNTQLNIKPPMSDPPDPIEIIPSEDGDSFATIEIDFVNDGGLILIDLPDNVLAELAELNPNLGSCVIADSSFNTRITDPDVTCTVDDFINNNDIDIILELCKTTDIDGIAQAAVEVIAESLPNDQFEGIIDIILNQLEVCEDQQQTENPDTDNGDSSGSSSSSGGCSIASTNNSTTGLPLLFLIPAFIFIRRLTRKYKSS